MYHVCTLSCSFTPSRRSSNPLSFVVTRRESKFACYMWEGYTTAQETRVGHMRHARLEANPPCTPEGNSPLGLAPGRGGGHGAGACPSRFDLKKENSHMEPLNQPRTFSPVIPQFHVRNCGIGFQEEVANRRQSNFTATHTTLFATTRSCGPFAGLFRNVSINTGPQRA